MASAWIAVVVAIPILLVAPAIWNGYPLLEYDTGGYLARWYEGYLVPSRSTVFGLYLYFGRGSFFWINLGIQALTTLWILQLTMRVCGLRKPIQIAAIGLTLIATTSLPWLSSLLLTDIFAGLAILSLFILVIHGERISSVERWLLFAFASFAASIHSATLGVMLGLCCAGWIVRPFLRERIPVEGLVRGSLTIVAGAAMLMSANFALSGKFAWTPGGTSLTFGRMLQDGIVTRYLQDHCATTKLKLCPYRDQLPSTADEFLWDSDIFNSLGRFEGLEDEMSFIVQHSLAEYPGLQAEAALKATAQQLLQVATGGGVNGRAWHTYVIMDFYYPTQSKMMHAARQQRGKLDFTAINWIHVPVALASMLAVFAITGLAFRRKFDDVGLLAATVSLALLGNAFICGVISGPHDRYGARLAWIATLAVLIYVIRQFADRDTASDRTSRTV